MVFGTVSVHSVFEAVSDGLAMTFSGNAVEYRTESNIILTIVCWALFQLWRPHLYCGTDCIWDEVS